MDGTPPAPVEHKADTQNSPRPQTVAQEVTQPEAPAPTPSQLQPRSPSHSEPTNTQAVLLPTTSQLLYAPADGDAFPDAFPSYLQENYVTHTIRDSGGVAGNDLLMAAHPTGIAYLALAPTHAALTARDPGAPDARLAFDCGDGKPSLLEAVFRKGRGPFLPAGRPLCVLRVLCDPPLEFPLALPVGGLLMEANAGLQGWSGGELLAALKDRYAVIVALQPAELKRLREQVEAAASV